VDHALLGRIVERLAALEDDLEHLRYRQQAVDAREALERAAVDILHHDVAAVAFRHRVVDRRDVRMGQLARERSLGDEELAVALAVLAIPQRLGQHPLDRHVPTRKWIDRLEHRAGRAASQLAHDFVFADLARSQNMTIENRVAATIPQGLACQRQKWHGEGGLFDARSR
jgi:hypothetical protein